MAAVSFALALAGCGAEKTPPQQPAAPAVETSAAPAPPAAPVQANTTPAETAPDTAAPTRVDSAAAVKEDVSPEWKQRERSMAGTEQCLRQAAELEGSARARVEASCRARARS